MAEFKGMELPIGSKIEVSIPTHNLGVWGKNDDYYGLALRGVVKKFEHDCCTVEMTGSGFYGAYDYPSVSVQGKPVFIVIDPTKVESAEWSGDLFLVTLGK